MSADSRYFNTTTGVAAGWWDRRSFVRKWWHIYRDDPRWVPPYYPALLQALSPGSDPHLDRLSAAPVYAEALPRRHLGPEDYHLYAQPAIEQPVAAAVALCDPRRDDGAGYLALLHVVNDRGSLEPLLERAAEEMRSVGCRFLIGPTGLSPHLGTGLLHDQWDELPPVHTPYQPPYAPEIVGATLRPKASSQLYSLSVPGDAVPVPDVPARVEPLEPRRLVQDSLPLLAAACSEWAGFPPPDALEAAFLLRWISVWPCEGWLALMDDTPVGFVLLQPDLAPRLCLANGGRNPAWRLWLMLMRQRPVRSGRLLFGAVLPDWRGRGIGRQLLAAARCTARAHGWSTLTIGPLPTRGPAGAFLENHGAQSRRSYRLYQYEF